MKLYNRLTKNGEIVLQSTRYRSQAQNKKAVTQRLYDLLEEGLKVPKKRLPTKPSLTQKEERLKSKKKRSEVKKSRHFKANL